MDRGYQPILPDDADEFQAFFRQRRPPQTVPAPPAPSVHWTQQFERGDQGKTQFQQRPFIPQPSGADERGAMEFRGNASGGWSADQPQSIQEGQVNLYHDIPPEYSSFSNPTTTVPAMSAFQNIGNGPSGVAHALGPQAHDRAGEYYGPSQRNYGPAQSGSGQPYGPTILVPAITPTTSTSYYGDARVGSSSSQYITGPQAKDLGRGRTPIHGPGTSMFPRDRSYSNANSRDGHTVHRPGPSFVQRNARSSQAEYQSPPQPTATPHIELYEQIEPPRIPSDASTRGIVPAPQARRIAGSARYSQRPTLQTGEDTPVQFAQSPVSGTQSNDPYRRIETAQIPPHHGESEGATAPGSRPIAGQGRYAKNVDAPRVPLTLQGDRSTDLPQETEATTVETENGRSTGGKAKAKKRSRAVDTADSTQLKPKKKNKGKQKAQEQKGTGDVAPQTETRRPTNVVPLQPEALYMSYDAEREAQRVHDENYYPFAYVFPEAGPDGRDVVYRLTDETAAPVPEEEGCVYELVYIVSDVPWAYTQGATPNGPLVMRQTPTPESELPITMDAVYRKYMTRVAVVPLRTDDGTQVTTRTRKLGDGDVACDECGRSHKDTHGAKNAHQKRWHNDWITSIRMNEYACILCGNGVHTEPDQFRRHRKGEEGFRQCSYVVESAGWVHRMGVWLVMHYPELVLMGFNYWQFGYDFRDQLREWWAEETVARTATRLWFEQVGRQQVVVDGTVQVEIGMPLWQYYVYDLGLDVSEKGHVDEDGDRSDDDAGNAEE